MPRAKWEFVSRIEQIVPPLPEQKAIAHILGALDDKIEVLRRMNETLEAMARAIFKSWFIDFDPVRAKAAVRREHPDWTNAQVSRAACPNLKPEIAELFPDRLVESELGEIPEGWEVEALGNVADVNWGDTNVTKKSYVEKGFLAYSAKGPDGFLPYYDYDRTGVVLSAIGANSGFTWIAQGKWSCIKNTIRFWCTDESLSTEYLYYATFGNHHWPLRGSAQPFVSQGDARNVHILKPSENIGKLFGDMVRPLHEKSNCISGKNVTLAALRDALLPKLISGEIRVKDAERIAGRCI
jgi:type I restriction enzyme S subunit